MRFGADRGPKEWKNVSPRLAGDAPAGDLPFQALDAQCGETVVQAPPPTPGTRRQCALFNSGMDFATACRDRLRDVTGPPKTPTRRSCKFINFY